MNFAMMPKRCNYSAKLQCVNNYNNALNWVPLVHCSTPIVRNNQNLLAVVRRLNFQPTKHFSNKPKFDFTRRFKANSGRKTSKLRTQYRSLREKLLKNAAGSKSYKRLKDAYTDPKTASGSDDLSKMSLTQRLKFMVKHYGKVFIPLHYVVLPFVWCALCYAAVCLGFDVTPLLEYVPESTRKTLHLDKLSEYKSKGMVLAGIQLSGQTVFAGFQALALYKILTPIRYLVSISATLYIVRILRSKGYFIKPPSVKEAVKRNYFRHRNTLRFHPTLSVQRKAL